MNEQSSSWMNTTVEEAEAAEAETLWKTPSPPGPSSQAAGHSEVKLNLHELHQRMGYLEVKARTIAESHRIILNYLHTMACRFLVYRRLVETALETPDAVWLIETPAAREQFGFHLKGRVLNHMTPAAYANSVNKSKVVFCPICPQNLTDKVLAALLAADELHIIRSLDYAQEKFLKELGQRAPTLDTTIRTITYRDGRGYSR